MSVEICTKIKVLLVDDHPMVLSGIRQFLSSHENIEIIGEAYDGEEAVAKVKIFAPDIILMDITMPNMNGIEATKLLRKIAPEVRVIMLTMHDEQEYVRQFRNSGARGYVLKVASPAELIRAIESVYKGEAFFSPPISLKLLESDLPKDENASNNLLRTLTRRENEVLILIADGLTSKEISEQLFTSSRTIDGYRDKIMKKLNIHSVAGLTRYVMEQGLAGGVQK